MAINKKKKILITGLSGAVGQAIIPSLKKKYILSSLSRNGLKTDDIDLYQFTLDTISENKYSLIEKTSNLYEDKNLTEKHFGVITHYENIFLNQGKNITYIIHNIYDLALYCCLLKFPS